MKKNKKVNKTNNVRKSIDKMNEEFSNEVGIFSNEKVHSIFKEKKNYHLRFDSVNKK